MKKIILINCIVLYLTCLLQGQSIEETNRAYILEKLVFYYVDDPSTARPIGANLAKIEVDKKTISENKDIDSPLWKLPNNAGLKKLLKQLLCKPDQGGDTRLQRIVRNVLVITDKKVLVYLYNDIPNKAPHASWTNIVYCRAGDLYNSSHENGSWPCADHFIPENPNAAGHIGIGAYFYGSTRTEGGWSTDQEKAHVFIHELVHTQLQLVLEPTLTISMYGDGNHGFEEMIPSRNSAFNEGIATSFAMLYHFPHWLSLTKKYNDNVDFFVDNISTCGSATVPHCLQKRLQKDSVAIVPTCGGTTQKCYKLQNITPDLVLYSENITAHTLFQFVRQFRSELNLVYNIKKAIPEMKKNSNYTFTPLYKELIKFGQNFHPLPDSRTQGHLMTLAILDYYTGYKMKDKATMEKMLSTKWTPTDVAIDHYFNTNRATLTGFRKDNSTWDIVQLDKFAEHVGLWKAGK